MEHRRTGPLAPQVRRTRCTPRAAAAKPEEADKKPKQKTLGFGLRMVLHDMLAPVEVDIRISIAPLESVPEKQK